MNETGEIWKAHRRQKQGRHAKMKADNTAALEASGVQFTSSNAGETLLFREEGKPKIDFYPSTGRWCVANKKEQIYSGGAQRFLCWYRQQ